jgi:hypothetical protein
MKKIFFTISAVILFSVALLAQVAINTDNSVPDNSAMLDIKSSDKGILIRAYDLSDR